MFAWHATYYWVKKKVMAKSSNHSYNHHCLYSACMCMRVSRIDRGRGLHAEITHSALTVSLKLVTGDLTSVFLIILIDLICSSRVNLFQFLKASSYSCGISCHDCGLVIMYFTSPLDEDFNIYKTAHRIWLRILSIALEKELKVLDYV